MCVHIFYLVLKTALLIVCKRAILNDLHLTDAIVLYCECIYRVPSQSDCFIPMLFSVLEKCPTLHMTNDIVEEIKFAS